MLTRKRIRIHITEIRDQIKLAGFDFMLGPLNSERILGAPLARKYACGFSPCLL